MSGPPMAPMRDPEAELERLEAIRRRVLNVVGHELRTPVAILRGLAETAADADDRRLRDEIVPALLRNARRVEELLNEMLIASGVETALPIEEPADIDLGALVTAVWHDVAEAHERAPTDLTIEGGAQVRATRAALRMLFERVLENTAKYASGVARLAVIADDAWVRCDVDAPGPEMHPEEVELATEAFFRGEHAVMNTPGLGLGLPVAKALAEQAGGSLYVEALPGGGLRTVVRLVAA